MYSNGVYYMVATGGGVATRGAVVVLSSTNLTSWTSILSLSGFTSISTPSGTLLYDAAATPQGIVFPWVNPATGVISIVFLPSATPLVLVTPLPNSVPPNPVNPINSPCNAYRFMVIFDVAGDVDTWTVTVWP